MSDWVIRHQAKPAAAPIFWNGRDNDQHPPWTIRMAYVELEQAGRFPTRSAALMAFREGRDMPESCCQPVEVA